MKKEDLTNAEQIEVIRSVSNYCINKYGPKPTTDQRKYVAKAVHNIFPQLDGKTDAYKKLTTRLKNIHRPKVTENDLNQNTTDVKANTQCDDYEEMLLTHCITSNENHYERVEYLEEGE